MHLGRRSACSACAASLRLEKNGRGLLPTLRSVLFRRDDLLSAPSRELAQQGLSDALAASAPRGGRRLHPAGATARRRAGSAPVLRLRDEFLADACGDEGFGRGARQPAARVSRLSEGAAMIRRPADARRCFGAAAPAYGRAPWSRAAADAAAAGLTATLRRPPRGPRAVRWLERRGRKTPNCLPRRRATRLRRFSAEPVRPDRDGSAHERHARGGRRLRLLEERLGLDLPPARTKVREDPRVAVRLRLAVSVRDPSPSPRGRDDESGHGARPSRGSFWNWPTRRTAACLCCSRATRRCGARRTPVRDAIGGGGRCSCRAKGSATTSATASGRRARDSPGNRLVLGGR